MTKKCTRCSLDKPFNDFNKHPKGTLGLQAWCKQCALEYVKSRSKTDKEWSDKRNKRRYSRRRLHPDYHAKRKQSRKNRSIRAKQMRSDYLKVNGPCVTCGSWEKLEFDHIIPHRLGGKLRKTPSQDMWMWGEQRRSAELAKCQILCGSCHREKSALENRKYEHGMNLYERHGCRCKICRDAHAAKRRLTRARQKLRKLPKISSY